MKRKFRIRKNAEFKAVYKRGRSFSNELLVLYVFKSNKKLNRVGISVSKKVGKSVIRSRVKRLINESYRLNNSNLRENFDFVFIARNTTKDQTYFKIEEAMKNLFKRAGLYK